MKEGANGDLIVDKDIGRRRAVALWDFDIVWAEELRESLYAHGIFCEEIDSREELLEDLFQKKGGLYYILSQKTFEEIFISFQNEDFSHVIVVLEQRSVEKEIQALKAGVLEVLEKEKGIEIAAERIERLFSKEEGGEDSTLTVNEEERFEKVFSGIHFTVLEKNVLYEMFKKEGQIIFREELIRLFWEQTEETNLRVVDTIVKQLRKKIERTDHQIKGIYGKGYLLKKR